MRSSSYNAQIVYVELWVRIPEISTAPAFENPNPRVYQADVFLMS